MSASMQSSYSPELKDPTRHFASFLKGHGCCTILFFVALTALASPFALMLSGTASDRFSAAVGTRSYTETELITDRFPSVFNDRETLYIKCGDCSVTDFQKKFGQFHDSMAKYFEDGTVVAMTNYFTFADNADPILKIVGSGYYNQKAGSMLALLEFDSSKPEADMKAAVTKALAEAKAMSVGGTQVYMTGQTATKLQALKVVGKTIGMADGTGMIFIVLLFAWQVGSWRLTLIPVINTVMCLLISWALIYPLSKSGAIFLPSYVTNVCLFLSIALSVDYSFFHLSRFQELRSEGADLDTAVRSMVRTAGRVVLVSGIVLLFTWLAMAAFPAFGTNTLGYCAAITIFVCITVNLFMNPAFIYAFPNFFGAAALDACRCCRRRSDRAGEVPLTEEAKDVTKNLFGRSAAVILKRPLLVIVPLIVYTVLMPGAIRLFSAKFVVGSMGGGTPGTRSESAQIAADFPNTNGGVPLTLVFDAPRGASVLSEAYFDETCKLVNSLQQAVASQGITLKDFRGATMGNGGKCFTFSEADRSLHNQPIYQFFWPQSVNHQNTSTVISVSIPFDAFSAKAKDLVAASREAVDKFEATSGFGGRATVFHPMSVEVDAEKMVISRFPWVLLVTVIFVFSILAFRYRSLLLPVRMLFTTALPIFSVIGTGVFVFEDGIFNWTGIKNLQSDGGLVWINLVAVTFMLLGFALDYDIFLYSRIYADRRDGLFLEDEPAIINAVAKTGPVISTAGVIMALAFSGMVLQTANPMLTQMGFMMIFGILMDTFIVRTLLVPTFLNMAGRYNWLPLKMPSTIAEGDRGTSLSVAPAGF